MKGKKALGRALDNWQTSGWVLCFQSNLLAFNPYFITLAGHHYAYFLDKIAQVQEEKCPCLPLWISFRTLNPWKSFTLILKSFRHRSKQSKQKKQKPTFPWDGWRNIPLRKFPRVTSCMRKIDAPSTEKENWKSPFCLIWSRIHFSYKYQNNSCLLNLSYT